MVWFGDSAESGKQEQPGSPPTSPLSSNGGGYKQFRKRLHEEILRSQRCTHTFTLMRLSVDAHTEDSQDNPLEDVLKSAIREYDLLCSVKPTEYFIAFPETNEKHAEVIADRIRRKVANKNWKSGATLSLEASIGIACFPHDGTNTEDLLHSAEQDLKQSRRSPR